MSKLVGDPWGCFLGVVHAMVLQELLIAAASGNCAPGFRSGSAGA